MMTPSLSCYQSNIISILYFQVNYHPVFLGDFKFSLPDSRLSELIKIGSLDLTHLKVLHYFHYFVSLLLRAEWFTILVPQELAFVLIGDFSLRARVFHLLGPDPTQKLNLN